MRRALSTSLLALLLTFLPGTAAGQAVFFQGKTLLGGRRALDGDLVVPVQQYLLAEAGGARDDVSVRLDMRAATDALDPSTAGLEVYELLVRQGRRGGSTETVVGRQVLLTGTGAWMLDGAHVTVHTGRIVDVAVGAGLERHPEVDSPLFGPHLALFSARLRGVERTAAQASYLLRDDRAGRVEHRVGVTAWRALDLPLSPDLDAAVEADAAAALLTLAEAKASVHPHEALTLSLGASRTEPRPFGPVLGDGMWGIFMAGPTDRARLQASWHADPVAVAGSCSLYRLRPRSAEAATGRTCRLAWSALHLGRLRPSGGLFALDGGVGGALGANLGLTLDVRGIEGSVRADVARYDQASGTSGSAGWLSLSLARALSDHLRLRAQAEGGRGADLEHDVRALLTLSYGFRGVRP